MNSGREMPLISHLSVLLLKICVFEMKIEFTRRELFCGLTDPLRSGIQKFKTKCFEFLNKSCRKTKKPWYPTLFWETRIRSPTKECIANNVSDLNSSIEAILDKTLNKAMNISPEKVFDDEMPFQLRLTEEESPTLPASTPSTKKTPQPKSNKILKYSDDFLKYGFARQIVDGKKAPQCVVCQETLSNNALCPSKLLRHLNSKHAALKEKSVDFFAAKMEASKTQVAKMNELTGFSAPVGTTEASYKVAHLIARQGKPHTIAEELILPCAKIMVTCVDSGKIATKLDSIPLSNNTVMRRIQDLTENLKQQLIDQVCI